MRPMYFYDYHKKVAANGKAFLRGIGYWFAIAIPATYTNSMVNFRPFLHPDVVFIFVCVFLNFSLLITANWQIRYLQSKLSIAFRSRLTRYVHDLYLDDNIAYYKL